MLLLSTDIAALEVTMNTFDAGLYPLFISKYLSATVAAGDLFGESVFNHGSGSLSDYVDAEGNPQSGFISLNAADPYLYAGKAELYLNGLKMKPGRAWAQDIGGTWYQTELLSVVDVTEVGFNVSDLWEDPSSWGGAPGTKPDYYGAGFEADFVIDGTAAANGGPGLRFLLALAPTDVVELKF